MDEKMNLQLDDISSVVLPDYKTEVVELIRGNLAPGRLREELSDYHENDIAEALSELTAVERNKLYSLLDDELLAAVFEYTDGAALYIDELSIRRRILILSELETAYVVEYLKCIDKSQRKIVLDLMDPEIKKEIVLLSSFDEDEIGSKMTTNYVTILSGSSIKEAMNSLVSQAAENDNISTLYVTDSDGLFLGAIDLKDLIIARKDSSLESVTVTSYPYVYASEQIDDCISRITDYSEDSIPVLDQSNRLIGVIISQDIIQLTHDEISDDYAKLAGLSAEEDLNEPLCKSIGKRLPWLVILLGLGLLVSSVVGIFEAVAEKITIIVSFQSLILGMAGNAGTQSLGITIRVLADEALSRKQKLLLIGKEARVGLANGVVLAVLSFLFIGVYVLIKGYFLTDAVCIALCSALALLLSIVLSSVSGTVIPLVFKKLGFDPAVASGPMITTVNDLVAVVSYYGLAWLMLINFMGM